MPGWSVARRSTLVGEPTPATPPLAFQLGADPFAAGSHPGGGQEVRGRRSVGRQGSPRLGTTAQPLLIGITCQQRSERSAGANLPNRGELRTRSCRSLQQVLDPAQLSSWRLTWQQSTGPEKEGRQTKGLSRLRPKAGTPQPPASQPKPAELLAFRDRSTDSARVLSQGTLAEGELPRSNLLCAPGDRQVVADESSVRRRPSQSR